MHPMISKPRKPNAKPLKTEVLHVMVEPDFIPMIEELESIVLSDWERINGLTITRAEVVRRSLKMFHSIKTKKVER